LRTPTPTSRGGGTEVRRTTPDSTRPRPRTLTDAADALSAEERALRNAAAGTVAEPATTGGTREPAPRTVADSVSQRPLIIRVLEGTADVYIDDVRVGTTPYTLRAPPGREMRLLLRRDGCDDLRRALRMEEGMQETVESLRNCRSR
ncbi:MAG: hypothetical protein MUE41_18750, partial [Gemmatimonadaceae bacterium]|nr:hypothetical protein [Gemmatimonadaceae bacterium]